MRNLFSTGLVLGGVFCTMGCGGGSTPSPSTTRASSIPTTEDVVGWALGSSERAPAPATADRMLLAVPVNAPLESATRVTPKCLKATSFLPAPMGDSRIFFLVAGKLHVRKASGQDPTMLAGNDPSFGITRLLAWKNGASPLQMLVVARPQSSRSDEIWAFAIDDRGIQAASPVRGYEEFGNQQAFFEKYSVPRCLPGGRQCLSVSTDADNSYVDVEPKRGQRPVALKKIEKKTVIEAAWASADGQSLYLLMPCF